MSSSDLDVHLYLFDGAGNILLEDDDSGAGALGTDSKISTALEPGIYAIGANTYVGEPTIGDHTLELSVVGE